MAEDGDVDAAFVLPEGFTEVSAVVTEAAEITIFTNAESEIGRQVAQSVAESYAAELNAVRLSVGTVPGAAGGTASPAEMQELQADASEQPMPARLVESSAGSRQFDSNTFFAAGIAVFFLFFTAQLGAVSLLQERKEGTLARLLAAPVSRGAVVGAKAIYSFVIGIVSMVILIVASHFLMDASWGDPVAVAIVVLAAVFAAMGLQSLVATLATTDEQAAGYGAVVGVTLGLLGGTFFPITQGPGLIAKLSYLSPHSWIMRALGELSGGAGTLVDVLPAVGASGALRNGHRNGCTYPFEVSGDGGMRQALSIAAVNAKRLGRDRIGLFFLFVFPIILILLLGVTFGSGFTPRLGVVSVTAASSVLSWSSPFARGRHRNRTIRR